VLPRSRSIALPLACYAGQGGLEELAVNHVKDQARLAAGSGSASAARKLARFIKA
jgi:hypothetical protein